MEPARLLFGEMIKKTRITLQPTETAIFQVAGSIYAAHLATGKIADGQEQASMERALREALQLAQLTDSKVQSDSELD